MKDLVVAVKSMSSLEIAELTGKEHRNVMSDIRKMLDELSIDAAKFSATYKAGRNNTYECFNLPKERAEHDRVTSRQQARLEAPLMTKALQDARARLGKESPPHVFSNDYDMIYRIVLGLPAKKYKLEQGIDDKSNLRDVLTLEQIKAVEALQRLNQSMHELDFDFETRKAKLHQVFMRNHAKPMIDEIVKDNS